MLQWTVFLISRLFMPPLSQTQKMWLIVFIGATILLITSGIRLSLGLFVKPIVSSSDIDIKQISFALAITQLMWGVSQPIKGALADRYGAWCVLFGGTLLLAVGCLAVPQFISVFGLVIRLADFLGRIWAV